jgi:hypothetical protein
MAFSIKRSAKIRCNFGFTMIPIKKTWNISACQGSCFALVDQPVFQQVE